jgi:hypothetical protein
MKTIALSLFVIGVATVNAGTVTTSSSSSGSGNNVNNAFANLQPSGSAQLIAAQGGSVAGGVSTNGWGNQANQG